MGSTVTEGKFPGNVFTETISVNPDNEIGDDDFLYDTILVDRFCHAGLDVHNGKFGGVALILACTTATRLACLDAGVLEKSENRRSKNKASDPVNVVTVR